MKITSYTFYDLIIGGESRFYKASQSGVEDCHLVADIYGDLLGFTCGMIFTSVKLDKPSNLWVFDSRGGEYFTTKEEAIVAHRNAVITYLDQLNSSSLKTYPILYGDPQTI